MNLTPKSFTRIFFLNFYGNCGLRFFCISFFSYLGRFADNRLYYLWQSVSGAFIVFVWDHMGSRIIILLFNLFKSLVNLLKRLMIDINYTFQSLLVASNLDQKYLFLVIVFLFYPVVRFYLFIFCVSIFYVSYKLFYFFMFYAITM